MDIPQHQRMERSSSLAMEHSEEHKAALARAVALDVPEAYSPNEYGTFRKTLSLNESDRGSSTRDSWDELAGRIFQTTDETVLRSNWY